jgi:hypothetical protein
VEVLVDYVCKDPTCTGDVAWHLIHGDLDCIGDNREALAEFARQAEALYGPLTVTVTVTSEGYVDHNNVIVLEPKYTDAAPVPPPTHEMEM